MREKLTAIIGQTKLQVERDEYGAVYLGGGTDSVPVVDRESLWQTTTVLLDGNEVPLYVQRGEGEHEYVVYFRGEAIHVSLETERDKRLKNLSKSTAGARSSAQLVRAPMPGLLKSVLIEEGQSVAKGDPLCILEAMKMENEIKAPGAFVVKRIFIQPGNAVEKATALVELASIEAEQ